MQKLEDEVSAVIKVEQMKEDSGIRSEEEGALQKDDAGDEEEGKTQGMTWSFEENLTLIMFIDYHKVIFFRDKKGKKSKIFEQLSKVLRKRTPKQCKNRYQKLLNKFNSYSNAKKKIIWKFGPQKYETEFQKFTTALESLDGFVPLKKVSFGRPKKNKKVQRKPEQVERSEKRDEGPMEERDQAEQHLPFPHQNESLLNYYSDNMEPMIPYLAYCSPAYYYPATEFYFNPNPPIMKFNENPQIKKEF